MQEWRQCISPENYPRYDELENWEICVEKLTENGNKPARGLIFTHKSLKMVKNHSTKYVSAFFYEEETNLPSLLSTVR